MTEKFLEDFAPGQVYRSGHIRVEADRVKSFASEFDPQPFHPDEGAARQSIFGGLAASGWHMAAITMRLLVASDFKPVGGIIGAGFDELRIQSHIVVEAKRFRYSRGGIKRLRVLGNHNQGEFRSY